MCLLGFLSGSPINAEEGRSHGLNNNLRSEIRQQLQKIISETDPEIGLANLYALIVQASQEECVNIWSAYPWGLDRLNLGRPSRDKLLKFIAVKFPSTAVKLLPTARHRIEEKVFTIALLEGWARNDLESAIAFFEGLEDKVLQSAILRYFGTAGARRDPLRMIQVAESLATRQDKLTMTNAVLSEWAKVSPPELAEYLIKNIEYLSRGTIRTLIPVWANEDLNGVKAWVANVQNTTHAQEATNALNNLRDRVEPEMRILEVANMPFGRSRTSAVGSLASSLSMYAPEKAVAWFESLESLEDRKNASKALVSSLTATDPEKAIAIVNQYHKSNSRVGRVEHIVKSWLQQSPDDAIAWATRLPGGQENDHLFAIIIGHIIPFNPDRAINLVLDLPNGFRKRDSLRKLIKELAKADHNRAKALVLSLDRSTLRTELSIWVIRYTKVSERDGIPLFVESILEGDRSSPEEYRSIATHWADVDFEAALEWAQELPEGDFSTNAIRGLLGNWGANRGPQAMAYVKGLEDPNARTQLTVRLAYILGRSDVEQSIEWVKSMQAHVDPKALYPDLPSFWANVNPELSASFVETIEDAKLRNLSISEVAEVWTLLSPEPAIEWVLRAAESDKLSAVLARCIHKWKIVNERAYLDWFKRLPSGETKDQLVSAELYLVEDCRYEPIAKLLREIKNERIRNSALIECLRRWYACDPEASKEWIEGLKLDGLLPDDNLEPEERHEPRLGKNTTKA